MSNLNPEDYTVGWISAILPEYTAAQLCLDEKHEPVRLPPGNKDQYTLGRIGNHNVVISVLPMGEYGTASAARVAESMTNSFPNIRIALMVGIGGGAPSRKHDIRLGDIVVGIPDNGEGGVLHYDFGKTIQDQSFKATGFVNQPPTILLTAVNGLAAQYELEGNGIEDTITEILADKPRLRRKFARPDTASDRLYKTNVVHPIDSEMNCVDSCGINKSDLISRSERTKDMDNPMVHYGLIASANNLMKDAIIRDQLSKEQDVLCFEMEAAGLVNHFPCLIIRGICDYADSHKNKDWQRYAAMVAVVYAKDLLYKIHSHNVEYEKAIVNVLKAGDVHRNTYIKFEGNNSGVQIGQMNGSFTNSGNLPVWR
ncbi:uncharacterized protein N7483_003214 [Penicillium malachiteum]|uniref:uncharacterized protein n=1 Tax=Penicillium malachiteum TaxID=1324776 RepID=UPI0025477B0F|nr:uncharacterized protein N7483_003214 [Penicillium malachiteum]KAJ5728706.1 hypothetical protein N7483_003214 [Penicillium malachiteum]